jgi:hypothetical protein
MDPENVRNRTANLVGLKNPEVLHTQDGGAAAPFALSTLWFATDDTEEGKESNAVAETSK